MPDFNLLSREGHLNYIPAELKENPSRWYIRYYVKNPDTGKLARKTIKLNRIKSVTLRRTTGRLLVNELNVKLARGWNPFIQNQAFFFVLMEYGLIAFVRIQQYCPAGKFAEGIPEHIPIGQPVVHKHLSTFHFYTHQ
jgi:hypothetical protein